MIDLYTWHTPNGHKVQIALEELGLEYRLHPVNLGQGVQREPEFLKVSPNGKIPAIIDRDAAQGGEIRIFESGAILLYLADISGELLPSDPVGRWRAVQWLMFQMGGVGPMMGQMGHFTFSAPEPVPYAANRYLEETERLYGVVDGGLEGRAFLADSYSIADIACFPWMRRHARLGIDIEQYPRVGEWLARIEGRPAVRRGLELLV